MSTAIDNRKYRACPSGQRRLSHLREQAAKRCAAFSAPPRLFTRECGSPPEPARMNPQGVGERPQRNSEYAHLFATLRLAALPREEGCAH